MSESHSVVSNSLRPHGLYSPWNSRGHNTGVGSLSLLQGIFPTQGSNPGLLHCSWIFLPVEPPGKPKNTGMGSLSLLQLIFPIQELNQGLLHCGQILYQLSYEGSPLLFHNDYFLFNLVYKHLGLTALGSSCSSEGSCVHVKILNRICMLFSPVNLSFINLILSPSWKL